MITVHLSCTLTSQRLQWYNNGWLIIVNSKLQLPTVEVRERNIDGNCRRQISHVISTYYKNCHSQPLSFKLWYRFCTPNNNNLLYPLPNTWTFSSQEVPLDVELPGLQLGPPSPAGIAVILIFPFEPIGHVSIFSFNVSVQFFGWEIEAGLSVCRDIDLLRFTIESAYLFCLLFCLIRILRVPQCCFPKICSTCSDSSFPKCGTYYVDGHFSLSVHGNSSLIVRSWTVLSPCGPVV